MTCLGKDGVKALCIGGGISYLGKREKRKERERPAPLENAGQTLEKEDYLCIFIFPIF